MKFPEQYRYQPPHPYYRSKTGDPYGSFLVPALKGPGRRQLNIIAADGQETGWEHVSVSLGQHSKTVPTWEEMCFVKSLFWGDDECVVQFHPAKKEYVNLHEGVLHLWKFVKAEFPTPEKLLV